MNSLLRKSISRNTLDDEVLRTSTLKQSRIEKEVLSQGEVEINVDLALGGCRASAWGCDLTYDYVKINGDYRT